MSVALPGWRQRLAPKALLRAALARRGSIIADLDAASGRAIEIIRETRRLVPLLMNDAAALHIQTCVAAAAKAGRRDGGGGRVARAAARG